MEFKARLKNAIEGTGETGETLVVASKDLIKTGAVSVKDLIVAVLEIAKETGVDTEKLVRDVLVGAVEATKDTTGSTEKAVGSVVVKAEEVVGDTAVGGGEAIRRAIAKLKDIVKEPLK